MQYIKSMKNRKCTFPTLIPLTSLSPPPRTAGVARVLINPTRLRVDVDCHLCINGCVLFQQAYHATTVIRQFQRMALGNTGAAASNPWSSSPSPLPSTLANILVIYYMM